MNPLPKGLPKALEYDWTQIEFDCYGTEWRDASATLMTIQPIVMEVIEVWWTAGGEEYGIGTELQLYAVVRFDNGQWGFVEAWNDYTGWGCQDGVAWRVADTPEDLYLMCMSKEGREHLVWAPDLDERMQKLATSYQNLSERLT